MGRDENEGRSEELRGVVFPVVDGARSSMATGQAIFADAARAIDEQFADDIRAESDWHRRYLDHVRRLTETEIRRDATANAVPSAGLAAAYERFEFVRNGATVPLGQAVELDPDPAVGTVIVEGRGSAGDRDLTIPYRGQVLRGDALHRQLDRWLGGGIIEPSCAEAVRQVMAQPDWLDLSDRTIAVLGAGSEMGPLGALCRWNATVVAIDLPRHDLWRRLIASVRAGTGRAVIPVRHWVRDPADDEAVAAAAGADLVTDLPEVTALLADVDGPLTLGNYVYADGATNVLVSMAVDALTAHLSSQRDDVSLAVLVTPTDVFAVPRDIVEASERAFSRRGVMARSARSVTRRRAFAANYDGTITTEAGSRYGLADCLVSQQGANYALAQRIQRWRARTARAEGLVSSANVAPASRTRSVTKNRLLAAAYAGAPRFGVEIFEPATSNVLMAALLVHDLRNEKSSAHPALPLDHPLELFSEAASHSGLWRIPFAPRSVLPLAAVLGLATRR